MRWIYLGLWAALAARDVPRLWRARARRSLVLWLVLACAGLVMAAAYFWGGTQWRFAEWVNGL